MRKVIKKKHSILIDVQWIRDCKSVGRRLDHEGYLLMDFASQQMREVTSASITNRIITTNASGDEMESNKKTLLNDNIEVDDYCNEALLNIVDEGWSKPISLDCCCVCHETDRDDCPWCVDCNVTLAKKRNKLQKKD